MAVREMRQSDINLINNTDAQQKGFHNQSYDFRVFAWQQNPAIANPTIEDGQYQSKSEQAPMTRDREEAIRLLNGDPEALELRKAYREFTDKSMRSQNLEATLVKMRQSENALPNVPAAASNQLGQS